MMFPIPRPLVLAAVALAAAAPAAVASGAPEAPVRAEAAVKSYTAKNTIVTGWYKGQRVRYFDLGPLKLRPGNRVAPIWTVANGAREQANIIDVVPGDKGYSPLWSVRVVTWKGGVTPRILDSKAAVDRAAQAGEVTIANKPIVVNCPVI